MVLSQSKNSAQTVRPSALVPDNFGNSPTTTSIAAPNRNPVTTGFDRNRAIQPMRSTARARKSKPVKLVTAATSSAAADVPTSPTVTTALPATAANAELGPVEI